MTYDALIDIINQNIKTNGDHNITGAILNAVLKDIADYTFTEFNEAIVSNGFYINEHGVLVADESWCVAEYHLESPLQAGNVIVWNGITTNYDACLCTFNGTSKLQAWSAVGTSRTITIAEGAAAIGANVLKVSFLLSNFENASVTINGSTIPVARKSIFNRIDEISQKIFNGIFLSSEIDSIVKPGIYRRDPDEFSYSQYILLVWANEGGYIQQLKIEASTGVGILMYRARVDGTWSAWEPAYMPNTKANIAELNNKLPITSDGCYKSVRGIHNSISLGPMELGTITDQGIDYTNQTGFRTPNNAKLAVSYKQVLLICNVSAIRAIIPTCTNVTLRVMCYNGSGNAIIRLPEQYYKPIGNVFTLTNDTKYIRLIIYFYGPDATTPITLSDYITLLNNNLANLFRVTSELTGVDLIQEQTYELQAQILGESNGSFLPKSWAYYGVPVNLNSNRFNAKQLMSITYPGDTGQACINWNDYLLVGGAGGYIKIYSLITKEVINTITLASAQSTNHINNLSWGREGASNNHDFQKYLYISETFGDGRLFVENFTKNGSQLVQTISFTGTPIGVYPEYVVDTDAGYLYMIGETEGYQYPTTNKVKIRRLRLPKVSEGATVNLTDADILAEWTYPAAIEDVYITQGCYYHNGKLYLCTGGYDNGQGTMPHKIFVIDLLDGSIVTVINTQPVFAAELESCCVWNGTMLLCYPNQQKVLQATF